MAGLFWLSVRFYVCVCISSIQRHEIMTWAAADIICLENQHVAFQFPLDEAVITINCCLKERTVEYFTLLRRKWLINSYTPAVICLKSPTELSFFQPNKERGGEWSRRSHEQDSGIIIIIMFWIGLINDTRACTPRKHNHKVKIMKIGDVNCTAQCV